MSWQPVCIQVPVMQHHAKDENSYNQWRPWHNLSMLNFWYWSFRSRRTTILTCDAWTSRQACPRCAMSWDACVEDTNPKSMLKLIAGTRADLFCVCTTASPIFPLSVLERLDSKRHIKGITRAPATFWRMCRTWLRLRDVLTLALLPRLVAVGSAPSLAGRYLERAFSPWEKVRIAVLTRDIANLTWNACFFAWCSLLATRLIAVLRLQGMLIRICIR